MWVRTRQQGEQLGRHRSPSWLVFTQVLSFQNVYFSLVCNTLHIRAWSWKHYVMTLCTRQEWGTSKQTASLCTQNQNLVCWFLLSCLPHFLRRCKRSDRRSNRVIFLSQHISMQTVRSRFPYPIIFDCFPWVIVLFHRTWLNSLDMYKSIFY